MREPQGEARIGDGRAESADQVRRTLALAVHVGTVTIAASATQRAAATYDALECATGLDPGAPDPFGLALHGTRMPGLLPARVRCRRGGRAAECTALLRRPGRKFSEGSNPSLSATFILIFRLGPRACVLVCALAGVEDRRTHPGRDA